jgi:CubicO group peptidase (beta-lactamase class C family)
MYVRRSHHRLVPIGGAVLVIATLAACAAAPPYTPEAVTAEIPSQDVVRLPDGSVDRAVEELPDLVERVLEASGVPGAAVAVVEGEEVLFSEGFGEKVVGEGDAVDEETVFQLASLSKPIGATVVATQVTQDVVAWNTPVAELLDGFALADPWVTDHVTVGDLYAHRSGLPHAAGDDLEDIGYDRDYIIDHLRLEPLDPFRATYNYANFGMTTGAEAVATAAGVDWATLSEQELYEPLGMTATSSRYADFLEHDNRTALHALVDGEFQALYERMPDEQAPAGGVSSNVVDLAKWLSLVIGEGTAFGNELVDPADLLPATSAQVVSAHPSVPDQRPGAYGYGFNTGVLASGRVNVSHSGAFTLGAGTNFQVVPELGLGIVVLTNAGPVGAAEAIAAEFLDRVQFGKSTRDWLTDYGHALGSYYNPAGDLAGEEAPASPAPARPLEEYAGTYQNAYFGQAEVVASGDTLAVRLGPDGGYEVELEPWDGDTFAFVPTGENAPDGSRSSATFVFEADGGAALTLEFFDANKLGTWSR